VTPRRLRIPVSPVIGWSPTKRFTHRRDAGCGLAQGVGPHRDHAVLERLVADLVVVGVGRRGGGRPA
jgi:hypothetical protein